MVNNNNSNSKTKKGGSWLNPFSSDENLDSCKAKCEKKYASTPSVASAPSTQSKGMFSMFSGIFGKKEEAKQPLIANQPPQSNQMGGKRRSKGSKKTRRNKKRKGTRKSSL